MFECKTKLPKTLNCIVHCVLLWVNALKLSFTKKIIYRVISQIDKTNSKSCMYFY